MDRAANLIPPIADICSPGPRPVVAWVSDKSV